MSEGAVPQFNGKQWRVEPERYKIEPIRRMAEPDR